MNLKVTTNFAKIASSKRFITICQGGSSSSKTYSILSLLYIIAKQSKKKLLISIVSESLPHLRKGCIADFENILNDIGHKLDRKNHNLSARKYKINNSTIEFFSIDKPSKAKGPRRDILYINECNSIHYNTFTELAMRTKKKIYLDYNPNSEFWVHDKIMGNANFDYDFQVSTYIDNEFCPEQAKKFIEAKRFTDPEWYKTYGLGQIGKLEGLIFPSFILIDDIPVDADFLGYGNDFGFANDPTTLIGIWKRREEIYIKEFIYETGLIESDLCKRLKLLNVKQSHFIIADSAAPSVIEAVKRSGYNIRAVSKTPNSILSGINDIKEFTICITKCSLNVIKEFRNYKWKLDISGNSCNEPISTWNHAIDAIRYVLMFRKANRPVELVTSTIGRTGFKYN